VLREDAIQAHATASVSRGRSTWAQPATPQPAAVADSFAGRAQAYIAATEAAAALSARAVDWRVQRPSWLAAPGLPLTFTADMRTPECQGSAVLAFMLHTHDLRLLHVELDALRGAHREAATGGYDGAAAGLLRALHRRQRLTLMWS
jgi:hypothetical protein